MIARSFSIDRTLPFTTEPSKAWFGDKDSSKSAAKSSVVGLNWVSDMVSPKHQQDTQIRKKEHAAFAIAKGRSASAKLRIRGCRVPGITVRF